MNSFQKEFQITKIDPSTKRGFGFIFVSKERKGDALVDYVDLQGDIVKESAIDDVCNQYFGKVVKMQFRHDNETHVGSATLHPMTEDRANATVTKNSKAPDAVGCLASVEIDDVIFKQWEQGRMTELSIGGYATDFDEIAKEDDSDYGVLLEKAGKRKGRVIRKLQLNEISVVPRGAQPDAGIRVIKSTPEIVKTADLLNTNSTDGETATGSAENGGGNANSEVEKMPSNEFIEKQELINKRLEVLVGLTDVQKAWFAKLSKEDQDAFISKSDEDRAAELAKMSDKEKEDEEKKNKGMRKETPAADAGETAEIDKENPVLYTRIDGTEIRKEQGQEMADMAKQLDDQLLKDFNRTVADKRDEVLKNTPGTNEEKDLIVKSILNSGSEEDQQAQFAALKKMDAAFAAQAGRTSTSNPREVGGNSDTDKTTLMKEFNKEVKALVEKTGINEFDAYGRVMQRNPERWAALRDKITVSGGSN